MARRASAALLVLLSSCVASMGSGAWSAGPSDRQPKEAGDMTAPAMSYAAALAAGHEAIASGDGEEAIADFDEALRDRPGDAQALAGRGYARLFVEGSEARGLARADLEAALAATKEPRLLGAIRYNLGLLADREGDGAAALAHYREAARLRPSKVSLAAARGTRACSVEIDRDLRPGAGGTPAKARIVGTWRGAYAAGATDFRDSFPPTPSNDREARTSLCRGSAPCSTTAPSLVELVDDPDYPAVVQVGLVVPQTDGRLLIVPDVVSDMREYQCTPSVELTEQRSSAVHRLTVTWLPIEVVGYDGRGDCTPDVDEHCSPGCMNARRIVMDFFVNPITRHVARLVRSADLGGSASDVAPPYLAVDLETDATGIVVRGCGVNERIPWP
jgi:hypothetical protein